MYREALPLFVLKGRKGGKVWMLVGDCHNRPEAHHSGFVISKLRFGLRLRLHGVVHDTPSPMAGLRLDTPSVMAVAGLFCGFFCGAAGSFFCGGSAC